MIPYVGLFISLVGAFGSTAVTLIFPPISEIIVVHGLSKLPKLVLIKDFTIILIGLIAAVTGTYASLVEIITTFSKENY